MRSEDGGASFVARVAVQQDQHANGDALAVLQAGADQVNPRAFQGFQQVPVGAGLIKAERVHLAGAAVGRQVEPVRHGRAFEVEAADAVGFQVLLLIVEEQAVGLQAALLAVDQVKQTAGGFADVDGFVQDAA
ncbi:hypothetical protein D3C85_1432640 [compost metagenome]